MQRPIEEDEAELVRQLLAMGGLVEEMLRSGTAALKEGAPGLLPSVHAREEQVNRLHIENDERCLLLLARYQPAASDLRLAVGAARMNADLERVGDQAVNVAQNVAALLGLPLAGRPPLVDLPRLAELAAGMLRDALNAFARRDAAQARAVIARDDDADRLKQETFLELVRIMQADVSAVPGGLALLLIARNLERVADHATNLAEEVIFMVQGRDVRHHAGEAETG